MLLRSKSSVPCLLYTSDAADERSSVDLGGRRIIKKKNTDKYCGSRYHITTQEQRRLARDIYKEYIY